MPNEPVLYNRGGRQKGDGRRERLADLPFRGDPIGHTHSTDPPRLCAQNVDPRATARINRVVQQKLRNL
jgi:hypothetical protein